jgi:hypothetical protein
MKTSDYGAITHLLACVSSYEMRNLSKLILLLLLRTDLHITRKCSL